MARKINRLTALLCGLCGNVESSNPELLTGELADWWDHHKEQDRKIAELQQKRMDHGWNALTRDEIIWLNNAEDVTQ